MNEFGLTSPRLQCDQSRPAIAVALTDRSGVVICELADGRYEYRGLRLRDNAALTIAANPLGADAFTANNDGVTYLLNPRELVVRSGDTVLTSETVLDYRGPGAAPAPSPAAAPPPAPAPLSVPDFPSLPVDAQGVGDGQIRFTAAGLWQFGYSVRCPAGVVVAGSIAVSRPQQGPSVYARSPR